MNPLITILCYGTAVIASFLLGMQYGMKFASGTIADKLATLPLPLRKQILEAMKCQEDKL